MDKKGIILFLALVFGLTIAIELVVLPTNLLSMKDMGKSDLLFLLILLCIPGIAAHVCRRYAPNPAYPKSPYLPPSWPSYALAGLAAPVLFVVVYTVMTFVGLVKPDWTLGKLMNELKPVMESMGTTLPPVSVGISTTLSIAGLVVSVLLGATVYALVALGIETGWRGYLLPRLMPLGRVPAYLIVGALWGLWFVPLIADWYYDNGLHGQRLSEALSLIARIVAMTMALSVVLGELWRRKQNIGLTAVLLGGFLGQLHGGGMSIWFYLFTEVREPWTGSFGLVSIVVWAIAALVALILPGRWAEAVAKATPAKRDEQAKRKQEAAVPAEPVAAASQTRVIPEEAPEAERSQARKQAKPPRAMSNPATKANKETAPESRPKVKPKAKAKAKPKAKPKRKA